MSIKLTNKIIDERLKGKHINRVGNYINAITKIEWKCDKCKHQWFAVPNTVSRGVSGCPSCNGGVKLTSYFVDEQIQYRNMLRLEEYVDSITPIKWKCKICEHEWNASPNNVINANTGCPVCSQKKAGEKKIHFSKPKALSNLKQRNISLLTPYTRIVDKHRFECNVCGYQWDAILNSIINNNRKGCKSCSGLLPLTNEYIDGKLRQRNDTICRVGNVINATTKIRWKCEHGHEWDAVPDSVLNAGTGCIICNKRGTYSEKVFKRNPNLRTKLANLYFLRFRETDNSSSSFLKIGISTRRTQQRFAGKLKKYQIQELCIVSRDLYYCWSKETQILKEMEKFKTSEVPKTFGGHTECFIDTPEVEQQILKLLNE